jgi:hypothetical protein
MWCFSILIIWALFTVNWDCVCLDSFGSLDILKNTKWITLPDLKRC